MALMRFFGKKEEFTDDEPVEGRPLGATGTTGLLFGGWYAVASQSLLHASRDDDPRCQKVLCLEARVSNKWASHYAKNTRQAAMCAALGRAIDELYSIAQDTPPLALPHDHPEGIV